MQGFLARLVRGSQFGATLVLVAGCNSQVGGGGAGGGGGGAGGGGNGGGGSGGGGAIVDEEGNALGALPELTCVGPIYDGEDFGYHGQCCFEVHCAAPVGNTCVSPDQAALTNLPPGSGECECDTRSGPFQNSDPEAADVCCYLVGSIGCDGRPLMIEGAPRLAEVITGTGAWSQGLSGAATPGGGECEGARGSAAPLDALGRARMADRWAERARYEHASIASFARFSMALLSCGAPPELVAASQQAGLDEVNHARLALAIASEYAGKRLDLGPLDISGAMSGETTLEALAVATVIEGCVGETLSAMEAAATAAAATAAGGSSRSVREALSAIAEDETRHAELAWAFVRWAAGVGGPALCGRIGAAFSQAFEQVRGGEQAGAREEEIAGSEAHGFLPAAEVARLRRDAIATVLRPAAVALLSAANREHAVSEESARGTSEIGERAYSAHVS